MQRVRRVLVIDDDIGAETFAYWLRVWNGCVLTITQVADGPHHAAAFRPDAILLSPKSRSGTADVLEYLRSIREVSSEGMTTLAVITSDWTFSNALREPGVLVLLKPCGIEQIRRAVRNHPLISDCGSGSRCTDR